MAKQLDKRILKKIQKDAKIAIQTIRNAVSAERELHPALTRNAAAKRYANKKGVRVNKFLDDEDRQSLAGIASTYSVQYQLATRKTRKSHGKTEKKIIEFLRESHFKGVKDESLYKRHTREVNIAYTYGAYTAVFMLLRKVVENSLIRLLDKLGVRKDLYFDGSRKRFRDFEVILDVFNKNKSKFPGEIQQTASRVVQIVKPLKRKMNDHNHSLVYVASKGEVDDIDIDYIMGLIRKVEDSIN